MKKIFTILFLFVCAVTHAQTIKFSELPAATTLGGTEIAPGVQSGNNVKISLNQVKAFVWDLSPTITTNDTIGYVFVRRTSDGKVYKRSVSSIFSASNFVPKLFTGNINVDADGNDLTFTDIGSLTLNILNDFNLNIGADFKVNGVAPTPGEFLGHDGWAVPPGSGGGSSSSAVLDVETTQVGNVTTGEDVLYTYTLPADTLNTNGEFIRGRLSGIFALNDNDKTLKLKFGGTTILTRLAINTPSVGQGWTIDWEVIRTGATTQKTNATFSGIDGIASAFYTATGETLSGTVDIVLTGEATATDDILKHSSVITFGASASGGGGGGGDLSLSDFVTGETPSGTVNGINVTFTTAFTPAGNFHLWVDGLLQKEGGGNDFTRSGPTITFVIAPDTGSIITSSYVK